MEKLEIFDRPECIFNLNETKAVVEQAKPAHHNIAGSGKDNTTVLVCISAVGDAFFHSL